MLEFIKEQKDLGKVLCCVVDSGSNEGVDNKNKTTKSVNVLAYLTFLSYL